jgi:uncharacterized membrane protein
MHRLKALAAYVFGIFLLVAGVNHFVNPDFYAAFVPDRMPVGVANWSSGILEVALGIGLLLPKTRRHAAWGALALMTAFLPLHIWDIVREDPAIGSRAMAYVRLPIQLVFIAWLWWVAQPETRRFGRR